ncbi:MAG: hypothetical protein KIS88_05860 [Anaerolineales bacterium]|nr:hypothetical protein [Anaerolineales bacterium]
MRSWSTFASRAVRFALVLMIGAEGPLLALQVQGASLEAAESLIPQEASTFYPVYTDVEYTPDYGTTLQRTLPAKEEAALVFELIAEPGLVGKDGLLSLRVRIVNNTGDALKTVRFVDTLEPGLEFVDAEPREVQYNARLREVVFTQAELAAGATLEIRFRLRVTATDFTADEIWLHTANLGVGSQEYTASTVFSVGELSLAALELGVVSERGGWVQGERTAIYFPADAVAESAVVRVSELAQRIAGGPELQFEVELLGAPGLVQAQGVVEESQRIALGEELEGSLREPALLEVSFDPIVDLSAIPAGKEPYVATYDPEYEVWVKAPIVAVDAHSNTVTVETHHFSTWGGGLGDSLPQNGAGALLFDQPYTALFTGGAQYSIPIWTPPGRAGMQPDIRLSYSSRTVDGVLGDVQAPWVGVGWNIDAVEIVRKITTSPTGYGYVNEFALTFNGEEHKLVADAQNPSRYYTERASFLYIERHNAALENGPAPNTTGEWWEIVATDGTRYRLGWNEDSEQLTLMYGYQCTTGNPCSTPDTPYTASGYAGTATNRVASRWRVDRILDRHGNFIDYAYTEEQPDPASQIPAFDRASYLATIAFTGFIEGGFEGTVTETPGYTVEFVLGTREGVGDVAPLNFGIWDQWDSQLLERIEIHYDSLLVRSYDFGYAAAAAPNANGTLTLTEIAVSGGGYTEGSISIPSTDATTITFAYDDLPNRAPSGQQNVWSYPRLVSIANGYGGQLNYTYEHDGRGASSWYNYRVQLAEVESGLGLAAVQRYAYATPAYTNQPSNGLGALYGYATVTEAARNFADTADLVQTVYSFGTAGLDIGRLLTADTKDPGGQVLRRVRNTYTTDNSQAPFEGWNFRYVLQSENFEWNGSNLALINKTVFQRDPLYGNLLTRSEYLGGNLYRKQILEYAVNPDPAVYILDRVASQTLRDANNTLLGETRYVYDGGGTLSLGELSLSQTLTGVSYPQSVDAAYVYDVFGNLVETRAYAGYGSAGSAPGGGYSASQVAYDSGLHTYPVSATNALGQSSGSSYLYSLGVPVSVTDPNGWTSSSSYDGLGRVVSTTAPGFGQANVIFTYPSPSNGQVAAPYSMSMQILDTLGPGAPAYRTVTGVYDGLSRILTQSVGGLTTLTEYDERGQVSRQSLPHASGETPRYVETSYDTLGRPTSSTRPGGITTLYSYAGLAVTTIDPNGHRVTRGHDGLGRMIRVDEYSGEHPSTELYASTVYSYTVRDQLVQVKDAQNNLTSISYDWLGRKTSMNDPDMGVWSYAYDALGNLVQQTDARGQSLGFEYDALGRLIEKINVNTSQTIATYTYGSTAGTIGFRMAMSDASGSTAWSYSNYGRTASESRTIDGETYTFTTVSDWLGRVASITYPDSEVVSYSYDALGRANGVVGSQAGTIAQLAYNSISQITSTSLGNGVQVTNTYDSVTSRLSNRNATNGSEDLIDFSYGYDAAGNITSITDAVLGESFAYSYDHLNRLLDADAYIDAEPETYVYRQRWEYDGIGNMLLAGFYVPEEPTPTETGTETSTPTASSTPTVTQTPTPTDTEEEGHVPGGLPGGLLAAAATEAAKATRGAVLRSKVARLLLLDDEPTETPTASDTPTASSTPSPTASHTATATAAPVLLGEWHMNETAGSNVPDSSGKGHNGTRSGATWTVYGVSGGALEFDGVDDYVNVSSTNDLKPTNSFSVAAWVNPSEVGVANRIILIKGAWDYSLRLNSDGYLEFRLGEVSPHTVSGPILPAYTWTYVVGVYNKDANTMQLYVNGQLVAAQAVTGSITHDDNPLRIGAYITGGQYWKGRLDEVSLYDRALTQDEIAARYTSFPTPTPTVGAQTATNTPTTTLTPSLTPSPTPSPSLTPTLAPGGVWGTGQDGNVTIPTATAAHNLHTTNFAAGRTCSDGGDAVVYSVTALSSNSATLSTSPSAGCLNVGDEILLANMQGANGSSINTGNHEFLRVLAVSGSTVTFYTNKENFYGSAGGSDAGIGTGATDQKVILQRVPNYADLTIAGTLTGSEWNGTRFGVLALRVAGELSGAGSLHMNALGYRGGRGGWLDTPRNEHSDAHQGESYPRVGVSSGSPNGGGGGGTNSNRGAGGGYAATGVSGINTTGGQPYGDAQLSHLWMGSGGGGGDHPCSPCSGPTGGAGGGALYIYAHTVDYAGTLSANGGDGACYPVTNNQSSGGGSGGTIRIEGDAITLDGSVTAAKGIGCATGDGSEGRIAVFYGSSLSTSTVSPAAYTEAQATPQPTATPGPAGPWGTGEDGNLSITNPFNMHTQNSGGRVCGDGGDAVSYSVTGLTETTGTLSQSPGAGCLAAGDEVLLIHMQGTSTNYANLGNYELLRVLMVVGSTVFFVNGKTLDYGNDGGDENIGVSDGQQKVVLMRVPNYQNVDIGSTLTGSAWDGTRFGVMAFRVAGELSGDGSISMSERGYRGGNPGWRADGQGELRYAKQGESFAGPGIHSHANNQGGGGGNTSNVGAGGGYASGGGNGINTSGGITYGVDTLDRLTVGSGGGGSVFLCTPCAGGQGGAGGGAILIFAHSIDLEGSIAANGKAGECVLPTNNTRSGGGSGGSIRLESESIEVAGAINATGGAGCAGSGPGGTGRIAVYADYFAYSAVDPAPWVPGATATPTPTPTPTTPTLQPGWHDGLYFYEGAQPHAVTSVERGEDEDTYAYDANGNMLERIEGETTWTQTYNAENRLSSISDGTDTWTFTYDGDGRRVRQVGPTGEVTHYVGGGIFEVRDALGDTEFIKYYGIAGQRVAMQDDGGIKYLLTDHLGSVSAVLDDTGAMLSQQRYTPYGETRFEIGITETDFGYTGQRVLAGTGLMDYNARFYAPGLGRWTQPDSIVPGVSNPQNLNRFSYVLNNPINFVDPSGHCPSGLRLLDGEQCTSKPKATPIKLTQQGELFEEWYEKLNANKNGWWQDVLGSDGSFTVIDAISMVMIQEAQGQWTNPHLGEAMIRAANQYCKAQYSSPCTRTGYINWFARYSQTAMSLVKQGQPTPPDPRINYSDWNSIAQASVIDLGASISNHPVNWEVGCVSSSPCGWGNNTADMFPEAVREHLHLNPTASFTYWPATNNYNPSVNSFFIPSGCMVRFWLAGNIGFHCPIGIP